MSIDALVHDIFVLHNQLENKNCKVNDVNTTVQDIIKQYGLFKPESHAPQELYQKANVVTKEKFFSDDGLERMKVFEKALISKVSADVPDLEKRMDRQKRFEEAVFSVDAFVCDISKFEEILKEGPVDLNAISHYGKSILEHAMRGAPDEKLLFFLLRNGAKFNMQSEREVITLMSLLVPDSGGRRSFGDFRLNDETLALFLRGGFDFNVALPEKNEYGSKIRPKEETSLLRRAMHKRDYDAIKLLVRHGVGELDAASLTEFDGHYGYDVLKEQLKLRKEMFENMQQKLPPYKRKTSYKELSIDEREQLAKLCNETGAFRFACDAWDSRYDHEREPFKEKFALHEKFMEACLNGRFEEAEKMLPQGIDLNARFITHPVHGLQRYPLLNHACRLGKVEAVKFLIDHGVKFDIGPDSPHAGWLPPILECAVNPIPNKPAILNLLKEHGANPNAEGILWENQEQLRYVVVEKLKKEDLPGAFRSLTEIGWDINVRDKQGRTMLENILLHPPYDLWTDRRIQLVRLLISYGATIDDKILKQVGNPEVLAAANNAKKIYDEVNREFFKEKELDKKVKAEIADAIPKFSLDVAGFTGDFVDDIALTQAADKLEVANRCLKKF
jgi:ankyrin repeat protein